jgi:hypothetical protein
MFEFRTQNRQSSRLPLQSFELGLPRPLTRSRVCPLVGGGGGGGVHTRVRERGCGAPNSDEVTDTVCYSRYICTFCRFRIFVFELGLQITRRFLWGT